MSDIAPPVAALVEELSKLPGIGVKTAQRLTSHLGYAVQAIRHVVLLMRLSA